MFGRSELVFVANGGMLEETFGVLVNWNSLTYVQGNNIYDWNWVFFFLFWVFPTQFVFVTAKLPNYLCSTRLLPYMSDLAKWCNFRLIKISLRWLLFKFVFKAPLWRNLLLLTWWKYSTGVGTLEAEKEWYLQYKSSLTNLCEVFRRNNTNDPRMFYHNLSCLILALINLPPKKAL